MRCLLQRVAWARVRVAGETVGETGPGLLALVGMAPDDSPAIVARMAAKVSRLRIFADGAGLMNRSVSDLGGGVLAVSQFTLYGDARGGNRPSFGAAARPEAAEPLFDAFVAELRGCGLAVGTGRFGAEMEVELLNDGPVTIWLDSAELGWR